MERRAQAHQPLRGPRLEMASFTLISPRIALQKGDFLGSGVPYWPLELAILASFLREKKKNVQVIDLFGSAPARVESKSDHYLQGSSILDPTHELKLGGDVVIVYALSYMSHHEVIHIVRTLRARFPQKTLAVLENSQAVTGYAISAKAEDFFDNGATCLICGDVYENWEEIEKFLLNQSSNVPSNVLANGGNNVFKRLNQKNISLPVPAWDLFPVENYWKLPYSHGPKKKKYFPILTSRGCPYPCDFCVVPETNGQRWRSRTASEVVEEMLALRDRFGVYDFQIEDLNPTIQSKRWDEICSLLIAKNAGIRFYIVSGTKAETVPLNQVAKLAEAGCRYLSISPESGSASVLKAIGKPFNYPHAESLIKACRQFGIYTQACFIVGHPSENDATHRASCDYLKSLIRLGLDEAAVFVISPYPGSKLYGSVTTEVAGAFPSFSPKGRPDWQTVEKRRSELVRIYFVEKIKKDLRIWLQGVRALCGRPRTKMENLPLRILYILRITFLHRFRPSRNS